MQTPDPGPSIAELPELVLRANLSEPPAEWELVAAIPFGRAESSLGFANDQQTMSLPEMPRAMVVDEDGSLWFLDIVKERVAHFTETGDFIEAIEGLHFDREHPIPKDIAIVDGTLYAIMARRLQTTVAAFDGERWIARIVTDRGEPSVVYNLLSSDAGLIGWASGLADLDRLGEGYFGYASLDPLVSGEISRIAGVPLSDGLMIDLRGPEQDRMELVYTTEEATVIQPVRIEVAFTPGSDPIPAVAGGIIEAPLDRAVGIHVHLAASDAEAGEDAGGEWYLQTGPDGEPVIFERIPESPLANEHQVRQIAAGPGDSVYLMVPQPGELKVFRR
ncbi:MAG: hypothetical protein H0W27_09475 [Actinobacteria bacterium]|nr:hypothetical protein [Actinomycetota bacterium]